MTGRRTRSRSGRAVPLFGSTVRTRSPSSPSALSRAILSSRASPYPRTQTQGSLRNEDNQRGRRAAVEARLRKYALATRRASVRATSLSTWCSVGPPTFPALHTWHQRLGCRRRVGLRRAKGRSPCGAARRTPGASWSRRPPSRRDPRACRTHHEDTGQPVVGPPPALCVAWHAKTPGAARGPGVACPATLGGQQPRRARRTRPAYCVPCPGPARPGRPAVAAKKRMGADLCCEGGGRKRLHGGELRASTDWTRGLMTSSLMITNSLIGRRRPR